MITLSATRFREQDFLAPFFYKKTVARKEACGRIAGIMLQYFASRTGK
ncbi:hypothetical protein [Legionella spiritensis]|nr:hypothetical protein [Legionella spiritensis]SNV23635.1 Uncharacterised protein [Legionella spiritensis]